MHDRSTGGSGGWARRLLSRSMTLRTSLRRRGRSCRAVFLCWGQRGRRRHRRRVARGRDHGQDRDSSEARRVADGLVGQFLGHSHRPVLHGRTGFGRGVSVPIVPHSQAGVDDLALGDVHIDRRDVEDLPARAPDPGGVGEVGSAAAAPGRLASDHSVRVRYLRPGRVSVRVCPPGFRFRLPPQPTLVAGPGPSVDGHELREPVPGWPSEVRHRDFNSAFIASIPPSGSSRIEFIWLGNTQTVAIRSRFTRLAHY